MKKKLIKFDLDGTLYELRGGSYNKSPLRRQVLLNARDFIAKEREITKKKAEIILDKIQKKYNEEISIGLEKEYNIDRNNYFNTVWKIPASKVVKKNTKTRKTLLALKKNYRFAIVSDAPRVWTDNVLKELKVDDLFKKNIYTGEGNRRKGFGNAFSKIIKEYKIKPADCIAVGDQEKTDIIPAKKLGMQTVFISKTKKSSKADYTIKSLSEINKVL